MKQFFFARCITFIPPDVKTKLKRMISNPDQQAAGKIKTKEELERREQDKARKEERKEETTLKETTEELQKETRGRGKLEKRAGKRGSERGRERGKRARVPSRERGERQRK